MKKLFKYRNVYVFVIILATIGFISGYIYFRVQPHDVKDNIINSYNINENLDKRVNNIKKRLINNGKILGFSVLIIPSVLNVFNIFYEPFQIGFIFNIFNDHLGFSLLFILIYYIIPLIFSLMLIKVGFTVSRRIINCLFDRNNRKNKEYLKTILLKYLIIFSASIVYEIFIFIFSKSINSYLLSYLS